MARAAGGLCPSTRPHARPRQYHGLRPRHSPGTNDTMAPRADVDQLLATWGGRLVFSRVYPYQLAPGGVGYSHLDFVWARYPLHRQSVIEGLRHAAARYE